MENSDSALAERSTHKPKFKGLNHAVFSTSREKILEKKCLPRSNPLAYFVEEKVLYDWHLD